MASTSKSSAVETADKKPMELIVDQKALLAEVSVAARAADSRGTQPILSHLLLEASRDGLLTITGSDLKRTLRGECAASVKTPGTAAVSAQKLHNYLRLLPEGNVSLKVLPNGHLQLQAGNSRTRMPGRPPAEFPQPPTPGKDVIRLSSRSLKTIVRQSIFAVATGEEKYVLNAALLLLRDERMGMVATDGRRLSLVETSDEAAVLEGLSKTLLPRECMTDLLSLLGSTKEESIDFSQDEANVYFRLGPRRLSVRKLAGQFPNYEAVLPRDHTSFTIVRTAELLTSVQRVLEFADERTSGVKLHLAENALTISSSAPERGESEETLPVNYSFPPVTIGFNGTFLVEFLKTIGGDGEVRLSLKDADSAALISPESLNADYQQRYVVMPMRI